MNDEIVITPKEDGKMDVTTKAPDAVEVGHYAPLQGFLEIDSPSSEDKDKLKEIWEYFNPDGKKTESEVLYAVKSTENRMGALGLGETRLNKIYQYARLRRDIETNEKLLNEL